VETQCLMKNSATAKKTGTETTQIHPALFQVAACMDISAPIRKDVPPPVSTPIGDLTPDKRKLEIVLKTVEKKQSGPSVRFIVDGQRCDDPQSAQRAPNPFGAVNAVMKVT
jgi:hypothetical protein